MEYKLTHKRVKIFFKPDENITLPEYSSISASGADVRASIEKQIILNPSDSVLVPTGLFLEIPQNFEVQIRPRSGLALKHQITVLNTPGTIDADYRGEIGIILINHGKNPFTILPQMRIAQIVVCPVYQAEFIEKQSLALSSRSDGGFGHSGVR
jgi:dUTP pyrophosphatase